MASTPKEQSNPNKKQETFNKLDDAYAESNLEDQLLVYWNRHKNQLLTVVTVAFLVIVGFQLTKWWRAKSISDRTEAYAEATDDSGKEAFADKFSGTDLGGVAFLELADKAYTDGDFAGAIPLYKKALDSFDMVEFKQRAHLGHAMALFQAGKESEAIKDLEVIANNAQYPDAARAEALYQLSVVDWKNGDFDAMLKRHDRIADLASAGNWQAKASQLQNSIPELKKLVEEKSSDNLVLGN
jgi:predicted negative regulator of RcsB-dependent stress response